MCPMAIRGKEHEIFGNIEELYQFHQKSDISTFLKTFIIFSIFLSELIAYERNPEDVGYCFIEWMEKLKELYADYCLNKEENNYLICLPETIKMFNVNFILFLYDIYLFFFNCRKSENKTAWNHAMIYNR